jgi:hypothetical protein
MRTPGARSSWSADWAKSVIHTAKPSLSAVSRAYSAGCAPPRAPGLLATATANTLPPVPWLAGPAASLSDRGNGPSGACSAVETMRVASSPTICS